MSPSNENSNKSSAFEQEQRWCTLAKEAQSGNKKSYNALLKELVPYIKSILLGSLANSDWADDIIQETLISVHKSLKTYSSEKPFKPWLLAIIHFRRTDFLRKYYSRKSDKTTSLDNPEYLNSYVTNPMHTGEYKDVEKALEQLPEKQRRVFELMKIQGFSAKEVANELGMSVSAVKVSAHRTMNKLKEQIQ